jgi:hypothetical protein
VPRILVILPPPLALPTYRVRSTLGEQCESRILVMSVPPPDSVRQHARDAQMSFVHESEPEPKNSLTSTADEKNFSEKDTSEAQVLPPKDLVCTPPEQVDDGDFPDGGLRAWLIVVGVRLQHVFRRPGAQLTPMFYLRKLSRGSGDVQHVLDVSNLQIISSLRGLQRERIMKAHFGFLRPLLISDLCQLIYFYLA